MLFRAPLTCYSVQLLRAFWAGRFKLNGLMMELSNALDTDVRAALEVCEVEATKPSSVTVTDLHRAAQEGTLMEPATLGGAGDPFSAREDSPTTRSAGIRSSKDPTVTNTALNGVSKLPFLVRADAAARSSGEREGPRDGEVEVGHGTGPVGGPTSPPRARAPPSMHDSVYAQLPQYDNSAIAYVQSFHAPRRTKSWRWCRASAREVTKCAQALHPTVRGPVELVIQTEEDAEKMKPVAPGSPKTKNVPSFRRRAGQSSKIPTMSDGKNVAGVNLFSRERISVGSEGIPPEWLASHAPATVAAGSAGENGVGPGSPTESTELLRRRALKFMLSNRETHYDLMDREVVDAVTILQMEQARAVAAARQQREQEAARGGTGAAGAASELDSHQFRTHQLLTEDYSGRQPGEDGDDELDGKASDEYSLYVSLPQMSAHTALTARQAVRTMQCASAGITMETIAKVFSDCFHD